SDATGFLLAVLSRNNEKKVRLVTTAGTTCGAWGPLVPGATLFEDAEPPSYLAGDGGKQVLFTRPPNDQTGRTLWRVAPGDPADVPELVGELPPEVLPPVSITAAGKRDVALTYPSSPSLQSAGGVGLLIADGDL